MTQPTYRVIQWATGVVGKAALTHFIENPVIELVGVCVTNPNKVGKDAGDLVGLPATGVFATDDVEALIALEALARMSSRPLVPSSRLRGTRLNSTSWMPPVQRAAHPSTDAVFILGFPGISYP
jgi:hypothetical protein